MEDAGDKEWQHEILSIARGWLFDDVALGKFPETVILPLENPDLHDESKFISHLEEVEAYKTISIGRHGQKFVGVLKSKFGAPAVAMAVDVLASMNVRSIIGVGFCGGLQERVECGDLVIPQACVRDDGTTARYVPEEYPAVADLWILDILREYANSSGIPWHCGLVLSTDAVMLESSALLDRWSSLKVIGVDMESGTLLTVARMAGIQAASILVASDNPCLRKRADSEKLSIGLNRAVELAFKTVSKL